MKASILGLAAAAVLMALPLASDAHGARHGRPSVSVGIGFGYPSYYYGYYPSYYYGSYYYGYPGSYFGLGLWPRYRERTVREGQIKSEALYVYPAQGQSADQLASDRDECQTWAADQSDYDPAKGAGSRRDARNYGRAFTACMEGRGYVVK